MYKFRFEFLELSDWFEYGLKAVGSQARQRCNPVVCRLKTIVEGTCLLYKIRESVDSLCRDGADAQYMQYLSKSRVTSPQTRKKLI